MIRSYWISLLNVVCEMAPYLLLGFLNRGGKHLVFNLLVLLNAQRFKYTHHLVRAKQTHQIIFQ